MSEENTKKVGTLIKVCAVKRQNEFTYLNSLTTSQIASLKDHASTVVTLEAYIRWLKEMIEKYGGRFNGNF